MGTYLDLTGRFRRSGLLARTPPPERCLDTIQDWFTRNCGDVGTVLERFEHRGQRVIGRATFNQVESEGKVYWQVNGMSAVPGRVGICTIDIHDRSQKDWALGVWKSIDRPIN